MPQIVGKLLIRATTLLSTSPQSKVCTKSYKHPKWRKSQIWEFQDSKLGSLKKKWHLGAAPMASHNEYYKGESGGFPQIWAMVNLMNPCMPMIRLCTESASTMH
jgi:hypothetical protein